MDNGGVPWKEHFFMIEEGKLLQGDKMTYIIYGDSTSSGWRVQAIPTSRLASFENRYKCCLKIINIIFIGFHYQPHGDLFAMKNFLK